VPTAHAYPVSNNSKVVMLGRGGLFVRRHPNLSDVALQLKVFGFVTSEEIDAKVGNPVRECPLWLLQSTV
jgi:hypothetical protein